MSSFILETEVHKYIQLGKNEYEIIGILKNQVDDKVDLENSVKNICNDYPDYNLIQTFTRSIKIVDRHGDHDEIFLLDLVDRRVSSIHRSVLSNVISPKFKWSNKTYTCTFIYNPSKMSKLYQENKEWFFNIYEPPFWMRDYFYSAGAEPIPYVGKIPDKYYKFFMHLNNGDDRSYNYTLDWISMAIKGKNNCILTTIGNQGVGKGVTNDIVVSLLGSSNCQKTDKRLITKDFNGQILNKKLAYLDEIKISSVDQENKIKDLINNTIEIEQKGKDPITVKNYLNIYYSSNNLDSVNLSDDDRRFSILEITDVKLNTIMSVEEIISLSDIADPKNREDLTNLGRYLFHRKIDENEMSKPFVSKRKEQLKSMSLREWQDWLLNELHPRMVGQTLPVEEVKELLLQEVDKNLKVGRPAIQKLSEHRRGIIEVKHATLKVEGKIIRKWVVEFLEPKEEIGHGV